MKPLPSDSLLLSSASSSSSSSSTSSPTIGLQSPGLQAEFLRVFRDRFQSNSDVGPSSRGSYPLPPSFSPTPSSPRTPTSSPSSPSFNSRQERLSLTSPELLSELRGSGTRTLRHVVRRSGMTTVFSGRGRAQATGATHT